MFIRQLNLEIFDWLFEEMQKKHLRSYTFNPIVKLIIHYQTDET